MEGGNAQKSEKAKAAGKGSQLESNKEGLFQCMVCLRTFTSEGKCREHKAKHAPKSDGSQLESNKERPFKCMVCLETFTSEVECREHRAKHAPKSDGTACFPHLKN